MDQLKTRRLKQLSAEEKKWLEIMNTAQKRISELDDRLESLKKELKTMQSMPNNISSEKIRLQKLIDENKKEYEIISSKLRETEQQANEINKKLKIEEVKLNEIREEKIRIEGVLDTLKETINQITDQVRERLNANIEELYDLAQIDEKKLLRPLEELEKKLERLIGEQERLGGVNLLAEKEAEDLEEKVNKIKKDQSDLLGAIAKLREAIDTLNTEGRQ